MPPELSWAERLRRALASIEPGRRFIRELSVPTVHADPRNPYALFRLQREVLQDLTARGGDVCFEFDFTHCKFLSQHAVAFIGGMIRLVEHRGGNAIIRERTLQPAVRRNLLRNGFLEEFARQGGRDTGNSIPYRQHRVGDEEAVIEYLERQWLGRGWVRASAELSSAIVGTMWEIYANAFEHSESPVGVVSCGQHYPNAHKLDLTVIDFGLGIPRNVGRHMQPRRLTAESALQWAFQEGATTSHTGVARGLGLTLLKEFVKLNNGTLEIFSNDAHAVIDRQQETFGRSEEPFAGTLVSISLRCKDEYYFLASEKGRQN